MRIITFGEILLRLSPEGYERFFQSDRMRASFGGGEANVAVSLAGFGMDAAVVTKLPDQPIGRAAIGTLKAQGVDTSLISMGGDRVGIYFLEKGAGVRGSLCVYDRAGSSIAAARRSDFDWESVFRGADLFHLSGITPALGGELPAICLDACKAAKAAGVKVSCDLNYRSKLWTKERAGQVMSEICRYADILIANTGSAKDVFGIEGVNPRPYGEKPDPENVLSVAGELAGRFGCSVVALTMRTTRSASVNGWSGMLYRDGNGVFSKDYLLDIVDRVGGGDSFAAGLIYGLGTGMNDRQAIEFAVAASALKHTIEGDFNRVSAEEVLRLAAGDGSGSVQR
ncbi:MAG: PfkB family carbohydrate kinase [Eubacteriales bacterium]